MKKMKLIFMTLAIVVVVAVGIFLIHRNMTTVVLDRSTAENVSSSAFSLDGDKVIQLSAPAENEEEAKKIAELYEIEYLGYNRGYGQYETDKDIGALQELGLENNYPDLEVIYKSLTK